MELQLCDTSLFSSMVVIGREWRINSDTLREEVLVVLVERILQPYSDFFLTHSIIQFSKKHMIDYLRWPPNKVHEMIEKLFM